MFYINAGLYKYMNTYFWERVCDKNDTILTCSCRGLDTLGMAIVKLELTDKINIWEFCNSDYFIYSNFWFGTTQTTSILGM
jgi:hypothetical protein